jgi:hypothetical protein
MSWSRGRLVYCDVMVVCVRVEDIGLGCGEE